MAKSTVTGNIIVPPKKFSTSLSEIFLFFILIGYESICFIIIVIASLTVGRSLEVVIKNINFLFLHVTLNPVSLQSVLAICFLPMATAICEIFESQLIRPAIYRAKVTYPYVLANLPPFFSICLVFYSFWNVISNFHERFEIFIEQNDHPLSCLMVNAKHIFRQALPCKVRDCWVKVDHDMVEEAQNTSKFIISLLYLTYFLWKWALKYVPFSSMHLSDSFMMQFKVNTVTLTVTLLSAGVLNRFSQYFLIPPDVLMVPTAITITLLAQYFPWDILFTSAAEGHEVNENRGHINEKTAYGVHGLYFILATAALACVFFGVEMESYYIDREDVKRELSPRTKEEMLAGITEHENSIKWTTGAFRGIFGFQIVMFVRTMIASAWD